MTRRKPAIVPASARGFTLLELVVVVMIVSIIVSVTIMSIGGSAGRRLDEEAMRLRTLVRLAADEAVLQGREIGILVTRDTYEFHVYDDQFRQWVPMSGDNVFRTRKMIQGMRLELRIDDQDLVLPVAAGDEDEDDDIEQPEPQILLLSSGEITPFELIVEFEDLDQEVVLRGLPNGTVETVLPNDR